MDTSRVLNLLSPSGNSRVQRLECKASSVWEGYPGRKAPRLWIRFRTWGIDFAKIMKTVIKTEEDFAKIMKTVIKTEDSFYLPLCQG